MSATKQAPPGMSGSSAGTRQTLEILAESATPDLYQRNGFRVLELPADATPRDINRRKQTVEKALAHNVPLPPGPGRCFPIIPAPDQFAVREVVQRLSDPERRLVDELFWFWPHRQGEAAGDTALAHLREGRDKEAEGVWLELESEQSESSVSTHNLALLYHLRALEKEKELLQAAPAAAQADGIDKLWDKSFRRWRTLSSQEGFWSRLTSRIRELEDPRLTAGTARRLRECLPSTLICISVRLALQAVERGRAESAIRLVETIRESEFEAEDINEGLRLGVESVRNRIKALCKAAELAAENDPIHADKTCQQLLENAIPLLEGIDTVLRADYPTCQVAHDDVAEQALRCQTAFANKTSNWRISQILLEATLPLPASESLRNKIQKELDDVRKRADTADNFRGEGYFDLPPAHLEQMENASKLANQDEFDQAISTLRSLPRNDLMACPHCLKGLGWTQESAGGTLACPFCEKEFQVPEFPETFPTESMPLLNKALGYCLGCRAFRRRDEAIKAWNQAIDKWNDFETLVIKKIYKRRDRIDNDTWGYAQRGEIPPGMSAHCMADGSLITGSYTVLTWTFNPEKGPVKLIICGDCADRHRSEIEPASRKKDAARAKLKEVIRQSSQDYVDGNQLDPANKFLQKAVEDIRKECADLGIGMPSQTTGGARSSAGVPPFLGSAKVCPSANWAIGLGVASVLCGLASIPAIVCGHVAVSAIGASGGALSGRKRAVAGLVLGYIFLAIHGISFLSLFIRASS